MSPQKAYVLAINGGSSSIKFTLYRWCEPLERRLHGKVDRIGSPGTTLTFDDLDRKERETRVIGDFDHSSAAGFLIAWFDQQIGFGAIGAVGHRVVSGGAHYHEAQRVTDAKTLERVAEFYRGVGWPAEVDGDAFTAPYTAPSGGPPPWYLYRITCQQAFGVATAPPLDGATKWVFD